MVIGSCALQAMLGAHRAEESAIVRSLFPELRVLVSEDELARAAVLEFGPGAWASQAPLLVIGATAEQRELLVAGVQILTLYRGAAQRSARSGAPCRAESDKEVAISPAKLGASRGHLGAMGTETARNGASTYHAPLRLGMVCDDDPAIDGVRSEVGEGV